ncbi:MAG: hypothetical protein LKH93_11125 [Clostridium beijerinckii]|jgi:hypothetical protein|nr:hypothetical protein [Clostridium beijerinckii]MCI1578932.1 hypothetical protein [Clostridium beijerinckii]MCI1582239.1 hypothetical protein [Clostridium beijerinckii]MCI1622756.1 hypothetical protein [Clostridium beijerinckii]
MDISNSIMKDCFNERNQVIFISEKSFHSIEATEEARKELLTVNKYIEYSTHSYDHKFKSYTIYTIKDRAIDQNNNLLLFSEMEYINE